MELHGRTMMTALLGDFPMLILEESDPKRRLILRNALVGIQNVSVEEVRRLDQNESPECDAVYVSFMYGLEHGASVNMGKAQILETNEEAQSKGWPSHIAVGVAWDKGAAPSSAAEELRMNLRSILEEVAYFNADSPQPIRMLRAQTNWLFGPELAVEEAIEVLRDEWHAGRDIQ